MQISRSAHFIIFLQELVNNFHLLPYSWKWNQYLLLGYPNQCYSNILKYGVITLFVGVITQLDARGCTVNMDFQKLDPKSFALMYVDKWSTQKTHACSSLE